MASLAPPEFKNSTKCQSCGILFGLITRKHHCRQCGNTFCGPHSQKSLPLPSYGFVDPVRVCDKCFDDVRATSGFSDLPTNKAPVVSTQTDSKETESEKPKAAPSSRVTTQSPREDEEGEDENNKPDEEASTSSKTEKKETRKRVANCKCNMPLCICPADPETEEKEGKVKRVEKKKTCYKFHCFILIEISHSITSTNFCWIRSKNFKTI